MKSDQVWASLRKSSLEHVNHLVIGVITLTTEERLNKDKIILNALSLPTKTVTAQEMWWTVDEEEGPRPLCADPCRHTEDPLEFHLCIVDMSQMKLQ